MKCGHVLHFDCFKELLQNDYRCTLCQKSVVDMTSRWKQIDMRIALAPPTRIIQADDGVAVEVPDELRTKVMKVLCIDCSHHFERLFSPYGLYKCGDPEGKGCGSYNTVLK